MKLFKIINPYKALMLDEAYLSTEFKIGFELEAIVDNEEFAGNGFLPSYHSNNGAQGNSKKLLDLLNERLGLGEGKIENDGSLRVGNNFSSRAWAFEYGSPIINFNPSNINKISKFLKGLKEIGVETNDTCGFHTHISFPDIDKTSIAWVLFSLANDEKMYKELTELSGKNEGDKIINFFGGYALAKNLDELKRLGRALKNGENLVSTLTNEKYNVTRIHPQGTIEWRGPRGFLNKDLGDKKVDYIEGYITKLYRIILKIADIATRNEYNGFTKKEVLNHANLIFEFNSEAQKKKDDKFNSLIMKIKENPKMIEMMPLSKIDELFQEKHGSFLTSELKYYIKNNLDNMNTERLKRIIADIVYYGDRSDLDYLFDRYSKLSPELSEFIVELYIFKDQAFMDYVLSKKLDIKNSELLNKLYNKFKNNYNEWKMVFINNSSYLGPNFFISLAKNRPEELLHYKNIPVKAQMAITRKLPWMIQYIVHPDEKVVASLKKKYGNEIDDYILDEVE